ncbi:MAG: amino acid adenylation domain-containing protein [Phycisphaeraceae bacterium]
MAHSQNSKKPPGPDSASAIAAPALPSRQLTPSPSAVMPVSFAQQQLWLADRLDSGNSTYTIAEAIDLRGPLDAAAIRASLQQIINRHEILRTTFDMRDGRLVQVIPPDAAATLTHIDLSTATDEETDARAADIESKHATTPFDLKAGPLARFALIRLSEDHHTFLSAFHHIVFDGWSSGVFWRELSAIYSATRRDHPLRLPELPIQYADYAQWQHEHLQGKGLERLTRYWSEQLLPAAPALELPCDRPRPLHSTHAGETETITLPADLSRRLAALAGECGATMYMTMLAAFKSLLYRYDGRGDVVVGTPVANRSQPELADLIGFFVNTLVLRTAIDGQQTFKQVLRNVKRTVIDGLAHQEMPFEQLVEQLAPSRGAGRNPLFQVAFMHAPEAQDAIELDGLTSKRRLIATHTAKFDLMLVTAPAPTGLRCTIEYSADRFDTATIERMLTHFSVLLHAACLGPDRAIASLPVMSEEEAHRVTRGFNHCESTYPRDETIHDRFAESAKQTPDSVAIVCDDRALTYRQLNEAANQLAHYLRSRGVGPEVLVSICLDRDIDVIVAVLAVLKAGGAYVPLDPAYPAPRIDFILEDTRAPILLTTATHLDALPKTNAEVFCLDRDGAKVTDQPTTNPVSTASPDHLAYVMYTSGSTGTPKGVMIPHRAVMRLVHGQTYTPFDSQQVWLHTAPISFDASTLEVWGPLLHGGKCVLVPHRNPSLSQLRDSIQREGVTSLFLTTALFNLIIDQGPDMLRGVKHVLTGGEAMSLQHIRRAFEKLPDTIISNVYGPTESTTFATAHVIDRAEPAPTGSVPIGGPIAHTSTFILDRHMQPVPVGARGQLYIGGDGLARGYLHQPDLTAERFVPDPFSDGPDARLYCSGDDARWLPDGAIEFLGRADEQVKIHGFRIEPGEIESRLNQHPHIACCKVIARDYRGNKRLIAYVVPKDNASIDPSELDTFLRDRLPVFMVPTVFIKMKALPVTPNGKIDHRQLPEPTVVESSREEPTEPRNATEEQLVELWQRMLDVPAVGIHDDFFALGGHSLLAARLFEEIRQGLGADLPLSILFEKPTIAQLSPLIRGEQPAHRFTSLVPLQPGGDRPPLFMVHGIGGDVLTFKPLIEHFPADQPLYGLQARGLNNDAEPDADIPSMAAHYVSLIREAYPGGPYLLGGFSSGGAVALEMAQQFLAAGQRVELVAVIDTSPPSVGPAMGRFSPRFLTRFLANLPRWLAHDLFRDEFPKVCHRIFARVGGLCRSLFSHKPDGDSTTLNVNRVFGRNNLPDRRVRFIQALYTGWRTYQAKPYAGRVTLLRAKVLPLFCRMSEQFGWEEIATEVDVLILPGTHATITAAENAQALAAALLGSIGRACRG